MSWIKQNSKLIEALAASTTALVAVAALIGVKFQLDANEALQKAQSARDAYRAHLTIAITHPNFAQPVNGCALLGTDTGGGYQAFVEHLLYSAEQMLEVEEGWESTFNHHLGLHADYMCSVHGPDGDTFEMIKLLASYRQNHCPSEPKC